MRSNDPGDTPPMTRRLSRRSWLAGVAGNTLARPTDRRHAFIRVFCIAVWVVTLPVAAVAGLLFAANGLHEAATEAQDRTSGTAVLLADAPKVTLTANGTAVINANQVAARWAAPDGSRRTGTVMADTGAVAGTTVPIWVDRNGAPVDPPMTSGGAVGMGLGVGAGSWLALGAILLLSFRLVVRALDRRRRAEWERDWERVAPIWLPQE